MGAQKADLMDKMLVVRMADLMVVRLADH
jgi:hypothetical protein